MARRTEQLSGGPPRVLVIDDEPALHNAVRTVLEHYDVVGALSGAEGRLRISDVSDLDVVLIDKDLPDCPGLSLVEDVFRRPDRPAVILLSGYPTIESAIEAVELGLFDYVLKPFNSHDLVLKVHNACERTQLERQRNKMLADISRTRDRESETERAFANVLTVVALGVEAISAGVAKDHGVARRLAGDLERLRAILQLVEPAKPAELGWNTALGSLERGHGGRGGGARVLVAEPYEPLRHALCAILRRVGYDANGSPGWCLASEAEQLDLILVDVGSRRFGRDDVVNLRATNPAAKVITMSPTAAADGQLHLVKPFDERTLIESVRSALVAGTAQTVAP
jgi:FixJ family two-component response regulator